MKKTLDNALQGFATNIFLLHFQNARSGASSFGYLVHNLHSKNLKYVQYK